MKDYIFETSLNKKRSKFRVLECCDQFDVLTLTQRISFELA
jgi:hypothetical protein